MLPCALILVILSTVHFSDGKIDSSLLNYYDLKVKENEASCRLVNHPNLPEDRRTLAGRDCMCDQECVTYKDCCKDSRYYRPAEQSQPFSHHCSETLGVYMVTQCSPNWQNDEVAQKCKSSIQPLESDDISLVLPVANQNTRKVYGNRYCAVCNNDLDQDNWLQFPMGVACGEVPPSYLKYESYNPPAVKYRQPSESQNEFNSGVENFHCDKNCDIPSDKLVDRQKPGFILDIHLYVMNDSVVSGLKIDSIEGVASNVFDFITRTKRHSENEIDFEKYAFMAAEICSAAKYDYNNKEFISVHAGKKFICRYGALLPENANNFTRNCEPSLESKCPADFKDETIKKECAIHTRIVYNKETGKPYRNKDCARCQGEKEDSVDGKKPKTRLDLRNVATMGSSGGVDGGVMGNFTTS